MNYGKKSAKAHATGNVKKKKKRRSGASVLKAILLIIVGLALVGVVGFFIFARQLTKDLPDASTIDISPTGYSTTVYDNSGAAIETLAASGANRSYVTLDEVPEDLQHAFVAIEDSRFYQHNGIDIQGIIRAAFTGLSSGNFSQGASTITQQLLKNNYFVTWMDENTFMDRLERKIQEQYLAVQLEKVYDKQTILENYLNTINLGQNTLGVESASERYFNKPVNELTLSECAVIAGITQNPTKYNPITHPEENATRRSKVLSNMLDQGYITEAEYQEAISDTEVYDRISVINAITVSTGSTSYFVDALTDQVIEDLQEKAGYSESEAYQMLYSGGLSIYSTEDSGIQNIVDTEINDLSNYDNNVRYSFSYRLTVQKADGSTKNYSEQTMLYYYQSSNPNYTIDFGSTEACDEAIAQYKAAVMEEGDTIPEGGETLTYTLEPQAAITIINQADGSVVALSGGRGDKTASKTLNRATGITRQPGSTFKILSTYAPAIDAAGKTLASVQDDSPSTYADGTELSNWDDEYLGYTTYREAIEHSINVVAIKTLGEIGTGLGFQYVQNFGISTLVSGDNNQALALGGITNGVTNLELCDAYATIANMGYYNEPKFYTAVVDHSGNVILDNTQSNPKQVLKETTAWLLIDAMRGVMTSANGTGGSAHFDGQDLFGKSGTTTKDRDSWFVGASPYYTCAVWGGYDDNAQQSYTKYTKNLWRSVMSQIHSDLPGAFFEQPEGIVQVQVCKKSGLLPIEGVCENDPRGSQVITEYFTEDTVPTEYCDHHVKASICTEGNAVATQACPSSSVKSGVFIVGGSEGTADTPYEVSENALNSTCQIHTVANYWQSWYASLYGQ